MKRTLIALALLLMGVSFGLGADQDPQQGTTELVRQVDELFAEWDVPGSPGGAVVLTHAGEVILRRSYGLASIEHGVPITPTTRFELASVSKPFTAFGVLLLEQAGRLSLDDDIRQHFPEFPDYGSPITIADLLHHTSGISDWVRVLPYAGRPIRTGFEVDDLLRLVAHQRVLEFEPGSRWSYSNTNYALLAEMVARVTGRPFGEWMWESVFQPLGMHHTSFPVDGARVLPNRANSYYKRSGGEFVRSLVEAFEIPGSAHAFSTIDDMAKWVDNLRTGRVGGLEIVEKMREKPTLTTGEQSFYGAGLGMGEYRGIRTAGHSGQTGAFKTELLYCPDVEVGVVVVGNASWMQAADLARRVLNLYLKDQLEPLPEPAARAAGRPAETPFIDLDPAEYERFLGGYRLEADPSVLVAFTREGEWFVGAMVGEGMDLFRPVAPSEFENRNRDCRLTFLAEEGEEGTADRVLITLRGQEMWATRVQLPADTRWADEFAGFYYSDELEAAYEIVRGPDGFTVRLPGARIRPLRPVDADVLVGGLGILTFLRDKSGHVVGFDFGEPEDLGERLIRFVKLAPAGGAGR
ncbi:MAG: serine hydrolase [Gemmatimonadales bacterium]|nr:serine hydrolase [Gemmatimonadales bacterium]NIR01216.1 serine hydrolase [Gemmatimonadales bacterium]NIS65239.1 serine hydrolase [Gemmatimonadales bacterium]